MIIDFNRYNGGGSASGVTPEQVQQQIDSALTPYWESGETKDYVDEAVSGLATEQYVQDALSGIDLSNYYTSAQTDTAIANAVSGLATEQYVQDALSGVDLTNYWTSAETEEAISAATAGKADKVNIESNIGLMRFPSWNSQGIIIGYAAQGYNPTTTINGKVKRYIDVSGNGDVPPIWAPQSAGTAGDILVSTGGIPVWSSVTFPDVSNYVTSAQVETQIEAKNYVNSGDVKSQVEAYNYATVSQIPTVPTSNTAFTNDAGYITDTAIENFVTSAQVETQIVEKNYVTSAQVETQITGKNYITSQALSPYTPTNGFATINGSAITNGGNITVADPDMSAYWTITQTKDAISAATTDFITSADTADMVTSTSVSTIWRGTQVQYDAIQVKDPNTFYIILLN